MALAAKKGVGLTGTLGCPNIPRFGLTQGPKPRFPKAPKNEMSVNIWTNRDGCFRASQMGQNGNFQNLPTENFDPALYKNERLFRDNSRSLKNATNKSPKKQTVRKHLNKSSGHFRIN
jgi:hypothetical protein